MKKPKWHYLVEFLNPDENGYSEFYSIESIEQHSKTIGVDLTFGNGADYVRTDSTGVFQKTYDYVLVKEKGFNYNVPHFDEQGNLIPKGTGKTLGIQLLGYMTPEKWALRCGQTHDHIIPEKIRKACLKRDKYCVFTGATTNLECDHKSGRYPKSSQEITLEDVQTVCKAINDMKREACKKCIKTGKRFGATIISYPKDWVEGDENFDSIHECRGCYLYDPIEFRQKLYG